MRPGNKPPGIVLLSGIYAFGAIVLLILWIIDPIQTSRMIAEQHGLPSSTSSRILPVMAAFAFTIAGGLFSLRRWGYLLTVAYLVYFGSVGVVLSAGRFDTIHFGNLIWALLVMVYLFLVRNHFSRHPSGEEFQASSLSPSKPLRTG